MCTKKIVKKKKNSSTERHDTKILHKCVPSFRRSSAIFFALWAFFPFVIHFTPLRIPNLKRMVIISLLVISSALQRYMVGPGNRYILVLDAGSTGSRIHVYEFKNIPPDNILPPVDSVTDKLFYTRKSLSAEFLKDYPTKGLSAVKSAAVSTDPLLKMASKVVPFSKWRVTPIVVRATAGLRFMDAEVPSVSNHILEELKKNLQNNWYFPFAAFVDGEQTSIDVMSGKEEGIYAWIALNWTLGHIKSNERTRTAAIVDLGGASEQLVFEVPKDLSLASKRSHTQEIRIGNNKYHLSYRSNELYGLISARKRLLLSFEIKQPQKYPSNSSENVPFSNTMPTRSIYHNFQYMPSSIVTTSTADTNNYNTNNHHKARHPITEVHAHCYYSNFCYPFDDHVTGDKHLICGLTNKFVECDESIYDVMFNTKRCSQNKYLLVENEHEADILHPNEIKQYRSIRNAKCNFVGIAGTQEHIVLQSSEVYATSFYFDNFAKMYVGPIEHQSIPPYSGLNKDSITYRFRIKQIKEEAIKACESRPRIDARECSVYLQDKAISKCFDLTYMYSLLTNGYGLKEDKLLTSVKLVNNLEVGWPLGVALASVMNIKIY